jgi:DNA-binding NarL/FixJ family response regulator
MNRCNHFPALEESVDTKRILIVDDHSGFRKAVSDYLKCLPNVVVVGEASDGIDVIEKTADLDPDIILMDISMPRRNGLEAARIIKNRWPAKKIIITTMHDSPLYRAQAEEVAADGFINKSSLRSGLKEIFANGDSQPVYVMADQRAGK